MSAPILVSLTRTVPRYVVCEHCETEFVYEMTRTGYGQAEYGQAGEEAAAHGRAAEAALADLTKDLDTGAEAVPCPNCRKYQRHMFPAARQLQWGWLRRLGSQGLAALPVVAMIAVLVAVIGFPGRSNLPIVAAIASVGSLLFVGLLTAVAFRLTPCEPNRWSEAYRAEQAASLACTREEFLVIGLTGGPFVEDIAYGREAEYAGVDFLWVLPEEIAEEDVVAFVTADGREVDVELSTDDHDGVFLDEERVDDPEGGGRTYRICLRVFSVYRPDPTTPEVDEP